MKPCRRCGGEKGSGRGRVYCDPCLEVVADASRQMDAEAARLKRATTRHARANGEPPPLKRVFEKDCPPGQKWCGYCQRFRPRTSFGTAGADKLAAYCIPCTRTYNRARRLEKKFGLTSEDYAALLANQGGCCAICDGKPRKNVLAVDHDHGTGEVRGLLCSKCNHRLLGAAHDSVDRLRKAIAYLEDPPARRTLGEPRYIPTLAAVPDAA